VTSGARSAAAIALAVAGALSSAACGGGDARGHGAPGSSAPASAGGASPWTLVYEHVVNGNQDLYLVAASGGVPRRLTDDPAQDSLPRFTPDGRSVLFTSDRSGNWQIWEVPAAGGDARRVRTNSHTEWQVDLSPDGQSLAFLSDQEGSESLFVMDWQIHTETLRAHHRKGSILGNPDWDKDSRRIVFSSNARIGHQIYVVDTESGEEKRLSALSSGGCEPRWRPDGGRIVYVKRGHLSETSRLVEHDPATGEEKVLVDWPALNYDPVYSPDASEIAFASNITGEYAVYRQRLSDGKSWRVTYGAGHARYPDYAPR
jgi:Tol biopolymer transport system component